MVGTPEHIVDEIERFVAFTDLDGFNVHSNVSPESYEDFVELVIPVLQRRGRFRSSYEPGVSTFRERLFGAGRSRLPASHPAAAYRGAFSVSEIAAV